MTLSSKQVHAGTPSIRLAHPIVEDDEKRAVIEALESGQLAQGPRVEAFERAFAQYIGSKYAVAVNSGTAALHVALLAHGIGSGGGGSSDDEVIVPGFSFAATANTVLLAGARPVFVDVSAEDFCVDPAQLGAAITPRTRAMMPVHLYGQMCDIEAIAANCQRHKLALIEDAAQAVGAAFHGRRAGSFGTGCFSFYATKNLQTGEGGMITTDNDAVAAAARMLRSQGESRRYVTETLGYNYRMAEMTAALGLAQLPKLDARNDARRTNATRLTQLLSGNTQVRTPAELPGRVHVWHQYTVRIPDGRDARDRLYAGMRERGIETGIFYPAPIHQQPLYDRLGYSKLRFFVAERLAGEVLSLPVHPALSAQDIETIAAAVNELTTP